VAKIEGNWKVYFGEKSIKDYTVLRMSTHSFKLSFHEGISICSSSFIFEVSKTEYSGRLAGVG
jgi:hypothetical protein